MTKTDTLVIFAKKHLGKPYKYGAKSYHAPRSFDCSSFVQYLYKRVGVKLPRRALEQASCGSCVDTKDLRVGDLLFFRSTRGHYSREYPEGIGHVCVYIGNGKIIQAKSQDDSGQEQGKVIEASLETLLTRSDFVTVRRVLN